VNNEKKAFPRRKLNIKFEKIIDGKKPPIDALKS
jgi:hypothetical protein